MKGSPLALTTEEESLPVGSAPRSDEFVTALLARTERAAPQLCRRLDDEAATPPAVSFPQAPAPEATRAADALREQFDDLEPAVDLADCHLRHDGSGLKVIDR